MTNKVILKKGTIVSLFYENKQHHYIEVGIVQSHKDITFTERELSFLPGKRLAYIYDPPVPYYDPLFAKTFMVDEIQWEVTI